MVMGNSKWRSEMSSGGSFATDTLWRSTPIMMWGKILHEVFRTYCDANMWNYEVGGTPCEFLRQSDDPGFKYDDHAMQGIHVASVWPEVPGDQKEHTKENSVARLTIAGTE